MISEITSRYIHARHTSTDGESYVAAHLVWSAAGDDGAAKFMAARAKEVEGINADAAKKGKPANARVEQITEQQYRDARAA